MKNLNISYRVVKKDSRSLAQLSEVSFNKKKILTPFLWFGVSIIENCDFQQKVFTENNIEGLLTNAYDLKFQDKNCSRRNMVRKLRNENGILVKCDSGGFQNFTRNKELTQEEIFSIQREIDSDIAIQLDFPLIPGASNSTNFKRIDKTIENFQLLLENNNKMAILPTIHGHNKEMIDYSISKISDILGDIPSAVAIGSLVPFLFNIQGSKIIGGKKKALELLLKIRLDLPETFIHVLGVGGTMTYLMYYLGIDSFDNSGWVKKAGFGAIQMPGTSDRFIYTTNGRKSLDDDENALNLWLECVCPACRSIQSRSEFFGRSKSARFLRSMHNIHLYQSEIWKARKYILEERLEEFVRNRLQKSIYKKLVDYIDEQKNI